MKSNSQLGSNAFAMSLLTKPQQKSGNVCQASFKGFSDQVDAAQAVFLISVAQKHLHTTEREYLQSVIDLLNKKRAEKTFITKKLLILVAGTLQRHNWWLFTKNYHDEELQTLLANVPPNLNFSQLALCLAELFLPAAQKLEDSYFEEYQDLFKQLSSSYTIKKWFDVVPEDIVREAKEANQLSSSLDGYYYQAYLNQFKQTLNNTEDTRLNNALHSTSQNFIHGKESLIQEEALRIARLAPHLEPHFLKWQNCMDVIIASSRNYLIEECPYLMPFLEQQGFNRILYPAKITKALQVTQELIKSPSFTKPMTWMQINLKRVNLEKRQVEALALVKDLPHHTQSTLPIPPATFRYKTNNSLALIPYGRSQSLSNANEMKDTNTGASTPTKLFDGSEYSLSFFTPSTPKSSSSSSLSQTNSQHSTPSSSQDDSDSPFKEELAKEFAQIDNEFEDLVLNRIAHSKQAQSKEVIINAYRMTNKRRLNDLFDFIEAPSNPNSEPQTSMDTTTENTFQLT